MALKVETVLLPGSRVEVKLHADAAEIEKAFDRAYTYLASEARVPGFRPGRAPRVILERRFDAETIRGLAWQQFLEKTYAPALEELDLRLLGEPEIPDLEAQEGFRAGEPLEMVSTLTVYPQPVLGDYRGLKLVRPSAEVTEEDVDRSLEDLRHAHAEYRPVERETVQEGDVVSAHVKVVNPQTDEVLEEYDADFPAHAESGSEMERLLVGVKPGGEVSYDLTLGEQPEAGELAGQTMVVQATVGEIQQELLPEVEDAFAQRVSEDLATVADLREHVRGQLAQTFRQDGEQEARHLAALLLDVTSEVDLPAELVSSVAQSGLQGYVRELMEAGMSAEQALERVRENEGATLREAQQVALSEVRRHYLLEAVAEAEGLEVGEADLDRAVAEYAAEHGVEAGALRPMVDLQPETEHEFHDRALRDLVLDTLLAAAEVEEVPREGYPVRARMLVEEALEAARARAEQQARLVTEAPADATAEPPPAADVEEEEAATGAPLAADPPDPGGTPLPLAGTGEESAAEAAPAPESDPEEDQ